MIKLLKNNKNQKYLKILNVLQEEFYL